MARPTHSKRKTPSRRAVNRSVEGERSDYLDRNRRAWERWALTYAATARNDWLESELAWGAWRLPESELQLLDDLGPESDVIELGSGTGRIAANLALRGVHPVAVDISPGQLRTAERLQQEFNVSFPLIEANAEQVGYADSSFDVAISEYGASLWCNPRRWVPEAQRLLRRGGKLIFFTNAALLMACTNPDGSHAGDRLVRDHFSRYRVEFDEDGAVEFHLTHGHWIRILRACGFVLEQLIEVRPPAKARPRYEFVGLEWARRWPSEEIWIARKQ